LSRLATGLCCERTVAEGLEPTMAALTERCLTAWLRRIGEGAGAGIEPAFLVLDAAYETAVHPSAHPRTRAAAAGLEPAHSRIPGERSGASLSYAAKDEMGKSFDGLGETRTHT
jgi:hypothetical protein